MNREEGSVFVSLVGTDRVEKLGRVGYALISFSFLGRFSTPFSAVSSLRLPRFLYRSSRAFFLFSFDEGKKKKYDGLSVSQLSGVEG